MTVITTGTLTCTNGSATVTGVGTSFVTSGIRAGWIVRTDDERLYIVQSVSSNTQLILTRPFLGASGGGKAYDALSVAQVSTDLAGNLAELITDYQTIAVEAGAGRFADGTVGSPGFQFLADADTGVRRVGPNAGALVSGGADRLQWNNNGAILTGLLTGTAVTQSSTDATAGRVLRTRDFGLGGSTGAPALADLDSFAIPAGFYAVNNSTVTGTMPPSNTVADGVLVLRPAGNQTTQIYTVPNDLSTYIRKSFGASSWGSWRLVYDSQTIIGTVSQTGGVPTGAIIQRGSNANGEFVRLADGTQICTHVVTTTSLTLAEAQSGGFRSAVQTWGFPAVFAASPVLIPVAQAATALGAIVLNNPGFAAGQYAWTAVTSQAAANRTVALTAVGRWF